MGRSRGNALVLLQARSATPAASSFQIQMPVWSVNRSSDLILNFTTADAAARQQESAPITFRGKPLQSVSLRKGYFYGNLAVVRFGSQYITAVRKIQFYLTPRTSVADYPLEQDPSKCCHIVFQTAAVRLYDLKQTAASSSRHYKAEAAGLLTFGHSQTTDVFVWTLYPLTNTSSTLLC